VDRKVAIGMRIDVLDREIADREQVSQTSDRRRDTDGRAQRRVAAAGNQLVVFEADAENRCDDGIRRHDPGKRQGELAQLCCHVSYSFLKSERLPPLPSRIWRRTLPASCPRQKRRRGPSCRWPWRWPDRSKCREGDLCRHTLLATSEDRLL